MRILRTNFSKNKKGPPRRFFLLCCTLNFFLCDTFNLFWNRLTGFRNTIFFKNFAFDGNIPNFSNELLEN